jgi:hypothetical protein
VSTPDVVYIVKAGESNEPLRHSLRSLAHVPHGRVWIVGYRPKWVSPDVGYIPTMQRGPKHANTWGNFVAAAAHPDISADFLLFNDDFFITRPIDEVPRLHRGTFEDMLGFYTRLRLTSHRQKALVTRRALALAGRLAAHSYELHIPMHLHRPALADAVGWLERARGLRGYDVMKRSFVGNWAGTGGTEARDVKVMGGTDGMPDGGLPFVSTSPQSWTGLAGGYLRRLLAEQCPYEREPGPRYYQPPRRGRAARGR